MLQSIKTAESYHWLMDRAYEDDATGQLATGHSPPPMVPSKSNRREPWEYDKELYKRCNEIERLFCRIKRFSRIFTTYENLDTNITLALIVDYLC